MIRDFTFSGRRAVGESIVGKSSGEGRYSFVTLANWEIRSQVCGCPWNPRAEIGIYAIAASGPKTAFVRGAFVRGAERPSSKRHPCPESQPPEDNLPSSASDPILNEH